MKKSKTKLQNLSQTHGKLEGFEYKTLDQVWGDDGLSKYKTLDEKQYASYLYELNKTDLQAHAAKLDLVPIDDREMLTKRLISEFKKHVSTYKIPKTEKSDPKIDKKTKDILSEGR